MRSWDLNLVPTMLNTQTKQAPYHWAPSPGHLLDFFIWDGLTQCSGFYALALYARQALNLWSSCLRLSSGWDFRSIPLCLALLHSHSPPSSILNIYWLLASSGSCNPQVSQDLSLHISLYCVVSPIHHTHHMASCYILSDVSAQTKASAPKHPLCRFPFYLLVFPAPLFLLNCGMTIFIACVLTLAVFLSAHQLHPVISTYVPGVHTGFWTSWLLMSDWMNTLDCSTPEGPTGFWFLK